MNNWTTPQATDPSLTQWVRKNQRLCVLSALRIEYYFVKSHELVALELS